MYLKSLLKIIASFIHKQRDSRDICYILTSYSTQCFLTFCFQDSADDAKQKSEDLLTACEELQKLLKESNEGMSTCC